MLPLNVIDNPFPLLNPLQANVGYYGLLRLPALSFISFLLLQLVRDYSGSQKPE